MLFPKKPSKPQFPAEWLPPSNGPSTEESVQNTDGAEKLAAQDHIGKILMKLPRLNELGNQDGDFDWLTSDAFEGTQIFGETGSGKTSGSGAAIARALLTPPRSYTGKQFGGLVLTAKTTDAYEWMDPDKGFLKQADRDPNKVIVLGEQLTDNRKRPIEDSARDLNTKVSFNFLDYEHEKNKKTTFNLVQLFLTALESGSQGNTGQEDAYWMDALRQLLTNAIELIIYSTNGVTLLEILEVVQTAPTSRDQARSAKWQTEKTACWKHLIDAEANLKAKRAAAKSAGERADADSRSSNFRQIVNYWLLDFAGLADRTRSVIVSTFTSKVTGLTRPPLFDLLCKDKFGQGSFVDIVEATRKGFIVIVNLPVKRYTEVGRFAQILIKTVWQRGIERTPDGGCPVFLWADEAQFFATKEDMLFQTTARSSRCATVYLTQNICNYYAMMPGKDPKSAADALLGNLTTKIFHANGDPTTNDWAQRLFGKEITELSSQSVQTGGGATVGHSQSPAPVVNVRDFATLRRGGDRNKFLVDALVFRSGFAHAQRKVTVLRTSFKQWQEEKSPM